MKFTCTGNSVLKRWCDLGSGSLELDGGFSEGGERGDTVQGVECTILSGVVPVLDALNTCANDLVLIGVKL